MCTEEQHREKMDTLARIEKALKPRPPIDQSYQISDTQKIRIDYHDRKHAFIWIPGNTLTIDFGEYGVGTVQSQVWFNLGMRPGREIATSGQATTVDIIFRYTDEATP